MIRLVHKKASSGGEHPHVVVYHLGSHMTQNTTGISSWNEWDKGLAIISPYIIIFLYYALCSRILNLRYLR